VALVFNKATKEVKMLKCAKCGHENFPLTEARTLEGQTTRLTPNCNKCGAIIMEGCPLCNRLHPVGTIFCPVNGKNIQETLREKKEFEAKYGSYLKNYSYKIMAITWPLFMAIALIMWYCLFPTVGIFEFLAGSFLVTGFLTAMAVVGIASDKRDSLMNHFANERYEQKQKLADLRPKS